MASLIQLEFPSLGNGDADSDSDQMFDNAFPTTDEVDEREAPVAELQHVQSAIRERLAELRRVETALAAKDELLEQVYIATELKRQLEKGVASQVDKLIAVEFQFEWLSSGSSILTVVLQNNSKFSLVGWKLAVEWTQFTADYALEEEDRTARCQTSNLPELVQTSCYKSEVFVERMSASEPCLLKAFLLKAFPCKIGQPTKTVEIILSSRLVSCWDRLVARSHFAVANNAPIRLSKSKIDVNSAHFEAMFAKSLVQKLASEEPREAGFLHWLLLNRGDLVGRMEVSLNQAKVRHLTLASCPNLAVDVCVTRVTNGNNSDRYCLRLSIVGAEKLQSHSWLSKLKVDLFARILLVFQRLGDCPKNAEIELQTFASSLDKLRGKSIEEQLDYFVGVVFSDLPIA